MKKCLAILMCMGLMISLFCTACDGSFGSTSSETNAVVSPTSKSGSETNAPTSGTESQVSGEALYAEQAPVEVPAADLDSLFENGQTPSGAFTITAANGSTVAVSGSTYTVTAKDTYVLSGVLKDGQIIVDAGEEKVTLVLAGVSLTSSKSAAILAKSADRLTVTVQDGTYNEIHDTLPSEVTSETENYDAALYAECDLTLDGGGTLVVDSARNNGVKTKDDLTVGELNLKVTAFNNALKGNDSVTVESGNLLLISEAADGVKTSSSDLSKKNKQKGTVSIQGGTLEIRSAEDGIQAAFDAEISGDAWVTIYTADYAGQAGGGDDGEKLYLIVPMSAYSSANGYYAYFFNDETGVFVKGEFETMVYSGTRSSYYGLSLKKPTGYQSVCFFVFGLGEEPSTETYTARSDAETLNASMNGFLFSSVSSGKIDGDWVKLSSNSSNSNKTTYSSKGIKAENEIRIDGGALFIASMDDGLHANGGEKLESGVTGVGRITISGGQIEITSADDGIHADGDLIVSGGSVYVKESHEGLEANQVLISGGATIIRAGDDGINACAGTVTPLIEVTGGYVDVTTSSGDTDGIDSNGNIRQSGGFILVRAGSSMGGMAGSVDVDGKIEVTGGVMLAVGGICELPSNSVNVWVNQGTSLQAGSYLVTNAGQEPIIRFTLSANYSSAWIAGDALLTGESYELLKDGTSLLNWKQSEGQTGDYSGSGFGPGSWGRPGGH